MSVVFARAVQWVCLFIVVFVLVMVFLAHASGRAAFEVILFAVVVTVIGICVGIAAKAEGIIHLKK